MQAFDLNGYPELFLMRSQIEHMAAPKSFSKLPPSQASPDLSFGEINSDMDWDDARPVAYEHHPMPIFEWV